MTTPKKLVEPVQLVVANTTHYTVPISTTTILKHASLHNSSSSSVEVTINLVPSGGSASTTNQIFKRAISPGETKLVYEIINATLGAGDSIQTSCETASAVSFTASGNEVT